MTLLQTWDKISPINENHDVATTAIVTGQNIDENFWDNFILVCNNKDGLASLLNVSPDKIVTWPSRIQQHLKEAGNLEPDKVNKKIIPTGEIGEKF